MRNQYMTVQIDAAVCLAATVVDCHMVMHVTSRSRQEGSDIPSSPICSHLSKVRYCHVFSDISLRGRGD